MGADIWVGLPGHSLGYFRDSYTGAITLNAIGLSYWQDFAPRLEKSQLPLEKNEELAGLIRQYAADALDGPDALQNARRYLEDAQMPQADPARMLEEWRLHIGQLLTLIELSTAKGVPLVMSL